jgi:excisionase family DNA binding protein
MRCPGPHRQGSHKKLRIGMNTNYIARVEVDRRADSVAPGDVDELMDELAEYAVAVGRSARGWLEIGMTVPGVNLRQATATALAVVELAVGPLALGAKLLLCEVTTEDEADARDGFVTLPSLIGTTEAAEILGVSPQRVGQLVNAGQLSAASVGRSLALARYEVEQFAQQERKGGRPPLRDASSTTPSTRRSGGSRFDVYRDGAGKFRWRLMASNGEVLAVGEAYETRAGAVNGTRAVQRAAEGASIFESEG